MHNSISPTTIGRVHSNHAVKFQKAFELRAVDLFAGAGGLSLGARLAGVKVTHAIENNIWAAKTYRHNHRGTKVIEEDIRSLPAPGPLGPRSILFGGPPCQGFSTSNQRTRHSLNPNNWLFEEFFRMTQAAKPEWLLLENVHGLRQTEGGAFESLIRERFQSVGYGCSLWSLCASNFGVPQKRHRLFFVGRRDGFAPAPPPASGLPPVTVRDAIYDLPELKNGADQDRLAYSESATSAYAKLLRSTLKSCTGHLVTANNSLVVERYKHILPGHNWTSIPQSLMQNYSNLVNSRSRHTGIYRRLSWEAPSTVIANYRKNMIIHPEQDRGLSVREAARIQSFPDNYDFLGSIGFRQQQVSNAVPPLLAKAVFATILSHC